MATKNSYYILEGRKGCALRCISTQRNIDYFAGCVLVISDLSDEYVYVFDLLGFTSLLISDVINTINTKEREAHIKAGETPSISPIAIVKIGFNLFNCRNF